MISGAAGSVREGVSLCVAADVESNCLVKVGFRSFACPHIIASCNWLAERLEGAPPAALLDLPLGELREVFDLPTEKAGKLLILQDAARACYADYEARLAVS
jgi:hypothetical protein